MFNWNHNGRHDIFDSLIGYEFINGSDENNAEEAEVYCSTQESYISKPVYVKPPASAKARRALNQVKNENLNSLIRETIRGYADYNCIQTYEAFERLMAREQAFDDRHLWWFSMEPETERMLHELQKLCVKRFEKEAEYHHGLCQNAKEQSNSKEFIANQHRLAVEKGKKAEQLKREVLKREALVLMEERSKAEQEKERSRQARLKAKLKEKKKARREAKIKYFCSLKWIKSMAPMIIIAAFLIASLTVIVSGLDEGSSAGAENQPDPIAYFISETYLPGIWKEAEPADDRICYYYFSEAGNVYCIYSRVQDDSLILSKLTDEFHVSNSVKIELCDSGSNYMEGRFFSYPLGHTKKFTSDYDEDLGLVLKITDDTANPYDTGNGVFEKIELPEDIIIEEAISEAAKEAGPFRPICPVKDCSYQVDSFSRYCSSHTCATAGCTTPKNLDAQCCYSHKCGYNGCGAPVSNLSDSYCDMHD